jgi:hypothetical protein
VTAVRAVDTGPRVWGRRSMVPLSSRRRKVFQTGRSRAARGAGLARRGWHPGIRFRPGSEPLARSATATATAAPRVRIGSGRIPREAPPGQRRPGAVDLGRLRPPVRPHVPDRPRPGPTTRRGSAVLDLTEAGEPAVGERVVRGAGKTAATLRRAAAAPATDGARGTRVRGRGSPVR